jgi:DNA polymerase-4
VQSTETPAARILLVDCDQFYVQVARLDDPDGAGRARLLIVGGSPSGRGVVTSASYETRRFGVRSAMPTSQALRLCPDAVVVGVSRRAVLRRSREVRSVLQALAPVVQAASVDEFYLDLSGTERMLRGESLEETARRIRQTVLDRTRISVSIGGGTQKTIAKIAANVAKPGGVRVVPAGQEGDFMSGLALRDIPGIGPALLDSLRKRGLESVADALEVQRDWLERWYGESRAKWLYQVIRGVDTSHVREREERKSISSERTFGRDLAEESQLEAQLLRLVISVGRSLRRSKLCARTVTVRIRDGDFTTRQRSRSLVEAVESNQAIWQVARGLMADLRRRRRSPCRLLGVGVTNLSSRGAGDQLGLFDDPGQPESDRDRALSRVVDTLRDRFGEDAVFPGRILSE